MTLTREQLHAKTSEQILAQKYPRISETSQSGLFLKLHPVYTVSQENCATFISTVTLANVGRFLKFFQCRNQKEMAHNKNEKFPTLA